MIRKTKIVCTLGPASDNDEIVGKLMDAGMNVCRLNMSHGSYEEQGERIARIKRLREEKGICCTTIISKCRINHTIWTNN